MSDQNKKRSNSQSAADSQTKRLATAKELNRRGDVSVATSRSLPRLKSPAELCHPDHLSIALSFLNTRDFAASRRVSRNWTTASNRRSAWPSFDLQQTIDSRFSGDFIFRSSNRQVDVALVCQNVSRDRAATNNLTLLLSSSAWRHLSDLQLHALSNFNRSDSVVDAAETQALEQLPQLPHLRTLTLRLSGRHPQTSVEACFRSLAPTLEALTIVSGPQMASQVGLLTNLRILRLTEFADSTALTHLHQLEWLDLSWMTVSHKIFEIVRSLSVHHRLRHFAIEHCRETSFVALAPTLASNQTLKDAPRSDMSSARLTSIAVAESWIYSASYQALTQLPQLQRLELCGTEALQHLTSALQWQRRQQSAKDAGDFDMTPYFPSLHTLLLPHSDGDASLELASSLPCLQHLQLVECFTAAGVR